MYIMHQAAAEHKLTFFIEKYKAMSPKR